MSDSDWEIQRYLSWEESQHGYSSDPTNVAGYDPTKHGYDPMPMNQYTIPSADPSDGEQGHFEYVSFVDLAAEHKPNPPTIPAVDTQTELDVVLHVGEGLTYLYWQPTDWEPPEWDPGLISESYDEDSFMKVADMHDAFIGRAHHLVGTMDNKIVFATATDPANYEEWDPDLGLAQYRLVVRRHDKMPAEHIRDVLADPVIQEVVITGLTFSGAGNLFVDISDQGRILHDLKFQIPAGGYRLLVCASGRQTADETVTLDMWPSRSPGDPDEVLKVEGDWGRGNVNPPDPRSSFFDQH